MCVVEAGQARADLLITPLRTVFEGRDRSTVITLINTTGEYRTYRLGWTLLKMNDKGKYDTVDQLMSASGRDMSADQMLRFSPRQVTLEPQGRQRIRISLRRPADLAPGEYRAHLAITRLAVDRDTANSTAVGGASAMLKVNLGFTIPVIVREGDANPVVTLENPQFIPQNNQGMPQLQFDIAGQNSLYSSYGRVKAYWTPANGQTEEVGLLNNVALYPEIDRRTLLLGLTQPSFSNGILTLVYEGDQEYEGRIFDKKSFNIK